MPPTPIKSTTQEHLDILDISQDIVLVKDGSAALIIQVSAVNFDLLSEEEQLLFCRLSVFTGDFSLEAVEEILEDDRLDRDDILSVLSQLVDKSLVNTILSSGGL